MIQKLVEKTSDQNRLRLLELIGPHIAAIGIHKNGTWAVQKIIDCCKTSQQIAVLVKSITSETPALLLDQFGNYVVQCCLKVGSHRNQFIFDAMAQCLVKIAAGRFGVRAMRACLESSFCSKRQQKLVATAVIAHAAELASHPNGSLLLTWLLDTSELPGRYRVLAPKLVPDLLQLSRNKIACSCILKIGLFHLNQSISNT